MRVLVTGAGGHLGRRVVERLESAGHDVVGLSRRPGPHAGWIACDLGAEGDLARAAASWGAIEVVAHLAAHVPEDTARNAPEDFYATRRANALGTAALLHALAVAPELRAVVYASTFEVYGPPSRCPIDEAHPTLPQSYYGASKLAGEKYLSLFAADRRLPCASLRFPAIYGRGDPVRRALGNFIRAAAAGGDLVIHGDGLDRRDLVEAGDAAEAVVLSIERRADGVFNVGTGRGFTIREMAEAVQKVGGGTSRLVHRDRVRPRVDFALDASKAHAILGWTPRVRLEEGIRDQLEGVRSGAASS